MNSSYTTSIELYNPNNETLKIIEIFSSDDDLHIELPIINYNSNNDYQLDSNAWILKPFENKILFNLRYIARHSSNHTAFIGIKSDSNQIFIITVEIEVTKEPGLYSPIELIDFGTMTHLQEPNTISIYLTNTANFDNETVDITVV